MELKCSDEIVCGFHISLILAQAFIVLAGFLSRHSCTNICMRVDIAIAITSHDKFARTLGGSAVFSKLAKIVAWVPFARVASLHMRQQITNCPTAVWMILSFPDVCW